MATDFLSSIMERKQAEVAAARKKIPEARLRDQTAGLPRPRPFKKRLEKPALSRVNIIAEIKRASPSKGMICADLDPVKMARAYEQGGAAALSVLTDGVGFKGDLADLKAAKKAAALPVLRKDFMISAYQLYESRVQGADAILLIVRILDPGQLKDYLALCRELQMDALVEVHSEKEIEIAAGAGAGLVGINNRNLRSFKTDLKTAAGLVEMLAPGQVAVAESGIKTPQDIQNLRQAGIWNFLIGESLVRAENPVIFLKELQATP
jgi:indole-3-glycerol phosphate synthase